MRARVSDVAPAPSPTPGWTTTVLPRRSPPSGNSPANCGRAATSWSRAKETGLAKERLLDVDDVLAKAGFFKALFIGILAFKKFVILAAVAVFGAISAVEKRLSGSNSPPAA